MDKTWIQKDTTGGSVVKNPPANAGDMVFFNPWSRKILHAVQQLSLCTTTIEPVLYSPGVTTNEAHTP